MSQKFLSFTKTVLPEMIIILCLLYAGIKFMTPLTSQIDIKLFDESTYLFRGAQLAKNGLPEAENAPLYAVWYFLLSLRRPDRIKLYYSNYRLLSIFLPIVFYLVLRRNKKSLYATIVLTLFILISNANLRVWPKVNNFALLVILASFFLASFVKGFTAQMALFSLGGLMGSYIRPELFAVYGLLSLVYLGSFCVQLIKKKRISGINWTLLFIWILISSACLIFVGLPAGGTERLNLAFAQHFSLHWVEWNQLSLDGWTDYPTIMQQAFGSAEGPWQALQNNPGLFAKHVLTNTKMVVPTFWNIFFDHTPILLLPWDRLKEMIILAVVVSGYLIYSLWPKNFFSLWRIEQSKKQSRNILKHFAEIWKANAVQTPALLVACAGYVLISPLSILMIWPRGHYIFLFGMIFILILALLAIPRVDKISFKQALICGVFLLAATPSFVPPEIGTTRLNTRNALEFLNSLEIKGDVIMLDADGGYEYYITKYPVQRIRQETKSGNFDAFLAEYGINMIVLSPAFLSLDRYEYDEEWVNFLSTYSTAGFERIDIPESDRWILISTDLLSP